MGGKCHTLVLKMPEAALTRWKHDHPASEEKSNAKLRLSPRTPTSEFGQLAGLSP